VRAQGLREPRAAAQAKPPPSLDSLAGAALAAAQRWRAGDNRYRFAGYEAQPVFPSWSLASGAARVNARAEVTGPLPAPFASRFDERALADDGATLVALDEAGVIVWTNSAWSTFARDNDGAEVLTRFGIGTRYLDGIAGSLRSFYEVVFSEVLSKQRIIEHDYECSSPDIERHLHLRVLPVPGAGLLLEHSTVWQAPMERPHAEALERVYRNADGLVIQCSNCRRVRRSERKQWDWVPAWVSRSHPQTSHGMCEICLELFLASRRGR
jgi:hypothetical protein